VISSVTAKIWDMVPSMNELLGLTRKTAEQVAAEHAALAQKAKRLDELRQKTRWSNAEQAEARRLVADLHGAYPELARDIDALGTSAAATAQVMERMAEAMEESLAKVQNQELQKAVDELAALNKQMDYFKAAQEEIKYQEETWMPTAVVRDIMDKGYMEGGARRVRRLKEELKGMPALIQKIEEAQERVATLLAARARGEEERGPKGPAATARREDVSDDARAAQDAADFRERMLYRLCELRSQLIEDERDREIELIRQRYRQEIDEAKKAGRDTLLIEQARMLEIRAIKQRFAAQERVEAERRAEERKGMEEEIAADTERLIIESTKQGYAKQAALLELQRRQALERAKEMGVDPRAVEEQFALRHQLLQQKHAADQIEKRIGVAGTFNAWAAGRMGGGRNPQERTARAAEEMKDDIKRLVRKAEDGRLVFAD